MQADRAAFSRKRVKRGESLYRAGAVFESIYALRSGFFKASVGLEDGRSQVTGFHMAGEIVDTSGSTVDAGWFLRIRARISSRLLISLPPVT